MRELGREEEAIELYLRIVAEKRLPARERSEARATLARIYMNQGSCNEALPLLRRAIKKQSARRQFVAEARLDVGRCRELLGEVEQARAEFSQVAEMKGVRIDTKSHARMLHAATYCGNEDCKAAPAMYRELIATKKLTPLDTAKAERLLKGYQQIGRSSPGG